MSTVNWDISGANKPLPNSHALIVGTSGSGKTFLIKRVILPQLLRQGLGTVILDFNGDFGSKDFLESLDNKLRHVRVDIDGLGFNPFVMVRTGEPQRLAIFISGFAELMTKVFDLGDQQRANLTKVMRVQYRELGFPDVIDDTFITKQMKWPNFRSLVIRLEDEDVKAANRIRDMADLGIFSEDNVAFSDLLMQPCVIGISNSFMI